MVQKNTKRTSFPSASKIMSEVNIILPVLLGRNRESLKKIRKVNYKNYLILFYCDFAHFLSEQKSYSYSDYCEFMAKKWTEKTSHEKFF